MTMIGQPESYSDILRRVFAATLLFGLLCTSLLAAASPQVRSFLQSWDKSGSLYGIGGWHALEILVPVLFAFAARLVRLHDLISDIVGIRSRFDRQYLLAPLARGVGFPTVGPPWELITQNCDIAMRSVFYHYASFTNPKIDVQLVRSAADGWGWFWCCIEPIAVLLLGAILLVHVGSCPAALSVLVVVIVLVLCAVVQWPCLRQRANDQVKAILDNPSWRKDILASLEQLAS